MGRITLFCGDITLCEVDAIVNAANERLAGGGGVDGAIHRAAGPTVMAECQKIGGCITGEAVITNAGRLNAKKIIHTVGPIWRGENKNESILLENSYRNSFLLAQKEEIKTIAFPAIGG
ncbi:MAG: macro domain-containing protein [Candidatus Ancaeobacter aquaticus]|nr:macro domain-containing protein [Candidatus Ancaeobacter aquaticus]